MRFFLYLKKISLFDALGSCARWKALQSWALWLSFGTSSVKWVFNMQLALIPDQSLLLPVPSQRCYIGNGTDYRGTAKTTISGHSCLPWNSDLLYQELHVDSIGKALQLGLGPFPYCRWGKFLLVLYLCIQRWMCCGNKKSQGSQSRCYPCLRKAGLTLVISQPVKRDCTEEKVW